MLNNSYSNNMAFVYDNSLLLGYSLNASDLYNRIVAIVVVVVASEADEHETTTEN